MTNSDRGQRRLLLALVFVAGFLVVEAVAGLLAGSVALLADAGHMLTDVAALGGATWAARLATRPASGRWTYGLQRAEVLSAAVNGISLLVVAVIILIGGLQRLASPAPVDGPVVALIALAGLAVNLAAARTLHAGGWAHAGPAGHAGHGHGHGDAHGHDGWADALAVGRPTVGAPRSHGRGLNVSGALAHVVTDIYASAATLLAGGLIWAFGVRRADPAASLAVAVLMMVTAAQLLRNAGQVLLEGAPVSVDLAALRAHLLSAPHVLDVHDLHVWTVTSDLPALSAHVVVEEHCFATGHAPQVLDALQSCLAGHFDVAHSTFQLEPVGHVAHEVGTH